MEYPLLTRGTRKGVSSTYINKNHTFPIFHTKNVRKGLRLSSIYYIRCLLESAGISHLGVFSLDANNVI